MIFLPFATKKHMFRPRIYLSQQKFTRAALGLLSRGKTGGHHISLYVEKYEKVNRILIISKTINCKRSNSFPYCQVIQYQVIHLKHKLNWFSKNLEIEILFWLIFVKDPIIQIMKFAQVFDKT